MMTVKITEQWPKAPTITLAQDLIIKNQLAIMIALHGSEAITESCKVGLDQRIRSTFGAFGIDPTSDGGIMQ